MNLSAPIMSSLAGGGLTCLGELGGCLALQELPGLVEQPATAVQLLNTDNNCSTAQLGLVFSHSVKYVFWSVAV